jgi:hypothetical protein
MRTQEEQGAQELQGLPQRTIRLEVTTTPLWIFDRRDETAYASVLQGWIDSLSPKM